MADDKSKEDKPKDIKKKTPPSTEDNAETDKPSVKFGEPGPKEDADSPIPMSEDAAPTLETEVDPTAQPPDEAANDLDHSQPPESEIVIEEEDQSAAEEDADMSIISAEAPEGEDEDDLDFLKDADPSLSQISLSQEEQEAEEAEFRAKYAVDLEEEDEGGAMEDEEEFILEGSPEPTEDQMNAIIQYLEDEEVGEGEGEDEEEEEEGSASASFDNTGDKYKLPVNILSTLSEREFNDEEEEKDATEEEQSSSLKSKDDEPNVMVLGPDHPKMARFQAALKDHLNRQINAADLELRQMDNELKMRKKERTDLGNNLYSLQNEVLRQSEVMEKYGKDMIRMQEKRTKTEARAKELKEVLVDLRAEFEKEQEKEFSLRESVKTLDYTEHIVRQAAERYDGELKIRQLVGTKLEKMRTRAEAEKRDQDFYLDKVLTHVQHMELINAGIKRQIRAHEEEQNELNTYINEAVTEIDALQIEKQHLQRAWNDTISVVRSRDDALNAAREALIKTKEELKISEKEMKSLSRLVTKEQEGHERSVIILRRRKMEERVLKLQLAKLENENERLKDHLTAMNKVKKQVEMELVKASNACNRKEKEVGAPRRKMEQLTQEKNRLEDQLLSIIQEQAGLSKASTHIQIMIKEARQKTRLMENEVVKVENEKSLLAVDVENLRAELFRKSSTLSELDKRCSSQEKLLLEQLKDIQQSERLIVKKTGEVQKLNAKLQKLVDAQGGLEIGPLEREILELEKEIAQEKAQVDQLQENWLKRQDDLVRLSTQRDRLILQNEMLRKEVFVMERKRQRLDSEVDKKKAEIIKIKKCTETYLGEISAVNAKLHQDRSNHDQMDKDNILIQNEFIALLKDAELEAIELERDIELLEEDKGILIQQLHEVHEQNLQWEKKVLLAKELKDSLKKEQEGSNTTLKLDIHHMTIRYNEIIRAQEKLMADLERSLERRDRIIQQADIHLMRINKHSQHTKINIQRNFASIRDKNKLLLKDVSEIENQVKDTMDTVRLMENKCNEASNELNKVRDAITACEEKIAEASVLKHKNLVEIVLRQEKFRILEMIKYNRYKPNGKTIEEVQALLQEAEKDCFAIVQLAEEMGKEYPEAVIHLKLVKASIIPNAE